MENILPYKGNTGIIIIIIFYDHDYDYYYYMVFYFLRVLKQIAGLRAIRAWFEGMGFSFVVEVTFSIWAFCAVCQ